MQKNYLAIDIGASSGRHIVGWMENGVLRTEEVYRFPNSVQRVDGHLEWDIDSLFANVKQGIREAFAKYPNIESLSIDTWAVDYVLLKNNQPIYPVYTYRDSRTQAVIPEVHSILPFEQLYQRTGIQFQPFNSIYQLYADKKAGRLAEAEDFLMIPEYLLWKLCGVKAREYTNATSTGLVNAQTGEYDPEILQALGLPETMFPKLTAPGTVLGPLKADIAAEVGGQTRWCCAPPTTPPAPWRASPWSRAMRRFCPPVQESAGGQAGKAHHQPGKLPRKLYQRGRRGLHPLPEKHHGSVDHPVCAKTAGYLLCRDGGTGQDQHLHPHF